MLRKCFNFSISLLIAYTAAFIVFILVGVLATRLGEFGIRFAHPQWARVGAYLFFLDVMIIYPVVITMIFVMMLVALNWKFVFRIPFYFLFAFIFELSWWIGFYVSVVINKMLTGDNSISILIWGKSLTGPVTLERGFFIWYVSSFLVHIVLMTCVFVMVPNLRIYFGRSFKKSS